MGTCAVFMLRLSKLMLTPPIDLGTTGCALAAAGAYVGTIITIGGSIYSVHAQEGMAQVWETSSLGDLRGQTMNPCPCPLAGQSLRLMGCWRQAAALWVS
jgi:hypothetical protein